MKGPMLWAFATLAAMQTMTAGAGLANVFPNGQHVQSFLVLFTASLQSFLIAYLGFQDKSLTQALTEQQRIANVIAKKLEVDRENEK